MRCLLKIAFCCYAALLLVALDDSVPTACLYRLGEWAEGRGWC